MALPENERMFLVTFDEYRRLQSNYDYDMGFADGYKQCEMDYKSKTINELESKLKSLINMSEFDSFEVNGNELTHGIKFSIDFIKKAIEEMGKDINKPSK